jgi:hypothetical protein
MPSPKVLRLREVRYEPGYGIGIVFLVLLAAPLLYGWLTSPGISPIASGLFFLLLALVFLLSYFQSHRSFLFRWFEWFCEHGSFPASRKMAFFYFSLACLVGVALLFSGLTSSH